MPRKQLISILRKHIILALHPEYESYIDICRGESVMITPSFGARASALQSVPPMIDNASIQNQIYIHKKNHRAAIDARQLHISIGLVMAAMKDLENPMVTDISFLIKYEVIRIAYGKSHQDNIRWQLTDDSGHELVLEDQSYETLQALYEIFTS